MSATLILISHREEDLGFWSAVADSLGAKIEVVTGKDTFRRVATEFSGSVVIWNAESPTAYESIAEIIPKYAKPRKVIALTDEPFSEYAHLLKFPFYANHVIRRYAGPAAKIYPALIDQIASGPDSAGIARYFPKETPVKRLPIARSAHKTAAIDAIGNHLNKNGLIGRVASTVVRAMDELIMNAVFDAPVALGGKRYRHGLSRESDFEMQEEKEKIELELVSGDEYVGLAVTDHFGSVDLNTLFDAIGGTSLKGAVRSRSRDEHAGMGLRGVVHAGLSLAFFRKQGAFTQAQLIAPRVESYKDFRSSFRFLSMAVE